MSYRDALAVQLEHILKQHPDSDKLTFIAERRDWLEIVDALRGEPQTTTQKEQE
jgi:hypothetical protein